MHLSWDRAAHDVLLRARRLVAELTAERMWKAASILQALGEKANFNPNQPRVPRGVREGGRWTDQNRPSGRQQPARPPNTSAPRHGDGGSRPRSQIVVDLSPQGAELTLPVVRVSDRPPIIPPIRPPSKSGETPYVKELARFLARVGRRGSPAGILLEAAVEAAPWIIDRAPEIIAYLDPPRKLAELQGAVRSGWLAGYDIHHIVERSAEFDPINPIPQHLIYWSENLVRIPRLKHWELNSWYETRNEDYGGLTPRRYLQGKDWLERFRVGEDGLEDVGVLLP